VNTKTIDTFSCKNQSGATLIEILITLIVLSIGLLGIASMQYLSLKNSNDAYRHYLASLHTQDLIDRMRANVGEARDRASSYGSTDDAQLCTGDACITSDQLAKQDLQIWLTALGDDLPNGNGVITDFQSVTNEAPATATIFDYHSIYTFTVTWDEEDISESGPTDISGGPGPTGNGLVQKSYSMTAYF